MVNKIKKTVLFPEGYWKKGGGELLGFAIIIPCIMLLIMAIVAATQIANVNQALNYCAYNTCRTAVVSDNYAAAEQRVQEAYELQFGSDNYQRHGYEPVSLELIDPSIPWQKGNFVRCTVRYHINTIMPFTSGVREYSIVMMIENGNGKPKDGDK